MGFRFFSLRIKLALVSVLLLTIPLIGFWYAAQLQDSLLFAQEQALKLTAKAVATILNERKDFFDSNILQSYDPQKEIHTHSINNRIVRDGLTDDWNDLLDQAKYYGIDDALVYDGIYEDDTLNFKHIIGEREDYYYMLFMVNDDRVVLRRPGYVSLHKSDHLRIAVQGEDEGQHDLYLLSPYASGEVNGHLMPKDPRNFVPEKTELRIHGYWRKTPSGYNIELRLPVAMVKKGRISFAIADVDDPILKNIKAVVGTSSMRQSSDLGFLLPRSPELENILAGLSKSSARISIIDSRFRQRVSVGHYKDGESNKLSVNSEKTSFWKSLLKPIYAFFSERVQKERSQVPKDFSAINDTELINKIKKGREFTTRRPLKDSDAEILFAWEPITYGDEIIGTVLVEQATNDILTEKNKIVEGTIDITLIIFVLGGIVLFAFASRLSGRIRKLAAQTETAIGPDGKIRDNFKASNIQDELGDLSRWFARILKRLKEYNTYQEKMADNLEHEIRTPIAGISASLANLEKKIAPDDIEVQNHFSGMKENIIRIESMMTSIREATLLKDALKLDEQTGFDLKEALLVWVRDGYKQTFTENSFVWRFPEESIPFYGDPIRIRQMLDKLIENAVDFSAVDSPVIVELSTENKQARISIINEGPELPHELQEQVFDSMVSIRKKSDKKSHLGLGLYVARQIVEFHGGSIQTMNRVGGLSGVAFMITLPLSEKAT